VPRLGCARDAQSRPRLWLGVGVRPHRPQNSDASIRGVAAVCAALFGRVRSGRSQHDRAIAANLGYAPADIDAMVRDGVLYAEEAVARLASTP
jgi:hypothetical protein